MAIAVEGRATIDNTGRDIKGNNVNAFATIRLAANYSQLVWTGYKMGRASVEFRVLAQAVVFMGVPIGTGWFRIIELCTRRLSDGSVS